MLLLPWLQYLGSSLGLLELPMNGWHPEWIPISSGHGGVDIGMYRLMRMLRFFGSRMKSFERFGSFLYCLGPSSTKLACLLSVRLFLAYTS